MKNNKRTVGKILSIALCAALTVPTAVYPSAAVSDEEHEGFDSFSVFDRYGDAELDIPMTDEDHDGIYQGVINSTGAHIFAVRADQDPEFTWGKNGFGDDDLPVVIRTNQKMIVSLDTNDEDYANWTVSYEIGYSFDPFSVSDHYGNTQTDIPMTDEDHDGIFEAVLRTAGEHSFTVRSDNAPDFTWSENGFNGEPGSAVLKEKQTVIVRLDTNDKSYENWTVSAEQTNPYFISGYFGETDGYHALSGGIYDETVLTDEDSDRIYEAEITTAGKHSFLIRSSDSENVWNTQGGQTAPAEVITVNVDKGQKLSVQFDTTDEDCLNWTAAYSVEEDDTIPPETDWLYNSYSSFAVITGYNGDQQEIGIPTEINGKTVTKIISLFPSPDTVPAEKFAEEPPETADPDAYDSLFYHEESDTAQAEPARYQPLSVEHITIPETVTEIPEEAFSFCDRLKSIDVDENNPNYSSDDGVLYNKDKTKLLMLPPAKEGTYVIPQGVVEIAANAVSSTAISGIDIPASVRKIRCLDYSSDDAENEKELVKRLLFGSSPNLTEINVAEDNGKFSSYDGILYNKSGSELLRCPQGKTTALEIPSFTRKITAYAFSGCEKLRSVTIPPRAALIENGAFKHCPSLTEVTVSDGVTTIQRGAFCYCPVLTDVTLFESVTDIEYGAFGWGIMKETENGTAYINKKNPALTIHGMKGSPAEDYAVEEDFHFAVYVPEIAVTELTLDKTSVTLIKGTSESLTATVLPSDATHPELTWSTSDSEIVSVSDGVITAVSAGTAEITAVSHNGMTAVCTVTVENPVIDVTSVKLNRTTLTMLKGRTVSVKATILPEDATDKTITWTTSNSRVATVSDGKITAAAAGTATVTAVSVNGKKASVRVTVQNPVVAVSSVTLNKAAVTLIKGKSETLTATILPSNATNKTITWTTSNSKAATVSGGKVTAVAAGTAVITAKSNNGKTVSCKVTVQNPPVDVTMLKLSSSTISLGKGEEYSLTAVIAPTNATNKTIVWNTSNTKVATVSGGKIKAVGNGTAVITAKSHNGKTASCRVTVRNAPTKVTLSSTALTLGVGESFSLSAAVNDGAASAKRTYRTSDSSVVKMTRTNWFGEFVAQKPGIAYVTVRTYNGKECSCRITVRYAPAAVTISKGSMTLKVGETAALSAIIPSSAGCATRTFRSSNPSVIQMTRTNWIGQFRAMKPGVAWVTVRTYNGKESSCKVTVIS